MVFLDPHVGAALVEAFRAGRALSSDEARAAEQLLLEQPGVERALMQREAVRLVDEARRADPLLSIRGAAERVARRLPVGPEAIRRWVRERAPFPQEQ